MIRLSVNVNKIATLRNARGGNVPDLLKMAQDIERFGAHGITVHPRPDERHIRYEDVHILKNHIKTEYNIEGNPIPRFMDLVRRVLPDQVTLVPDKEEALTSNMGWDIAAHYSFLKGTVAELKSLGIRTSIFIDPFPERVELAAQLGADRVELYTEQYARQYAEGNSNALIPYIKTAEVASMVGVGLNAGHDLSLSNIEAFARSIPNLLEVSIGHALICESLYLGIENVIQLYLKKLSQS